MPLITPSTYAAPWLLRNGHVQTVYPALLRRVDGVAYRRERLETPDGDFLDLDWVQRGASRVAVLSHGLEGNTHRPYVKGMARALAGRGWDVLAWNYRGCSGAPNRQLRSYHSGATDDLQLVVRHALWGGYDAAALIGFSLGGNLTLLYVGEHGDGLDPRIRAAVGFSVPCDLDAGCARLEAAPNVLYHRRFLVELRAKLEDKRARFPDALAAVDLAAVTTLRAFDEAYTAPAHGFVDAADYYARCSCKPRLAAIRIPTLLVNAADDPLLPAACYPVDEARGHPWLSLEIPDDGGHVGFVSPGADYWSEQRAAAFLDEALRA